MLVILGQINVYLYTAKEDISGFSILEKTISGLISGIILLAIGFFIFKKQKRFQILKEKEIEYEIKLFSFKKKFKYYTEKYTKKLTSTMFGGEEKVYELYSELKDIINFREYYGITDNVNLYDILNSLYFKFLILQSNKVGAKKYYNDIFMFSEEFEKSGMKISKKSNESYLEQYEFYNEKVKKIIQDGFFDNKKHK